ncbi:hypothetical protein PIB30_055572, partial [Stylosanthes scabra]|nr:hypothetical protein [Stylosanthes scabra]
VMVALNALLYSYSIAIKSVFELYFQKQLLLWIGCFLGELTNQVFADLAVSKYKIAVEAQLFPRKAKIQQF